MIKQRSSDNGNDDGAIKLRYGDSRTEPIKDRFEEKPLDIGRNNLEQSKAYLEFNATTTAGRKSIAEYHGIQGWKGESNKKLAQDVIYDLLLSVKKRSNKTLNCSFGNIEGFHRSLASIMLLTGRFIKPEDGTLSDKLDWGVLEKNNVIQNENPHIVRLKKSGDLQYHISQALNSEKEENRWFTVVKNVEVYWVKVDEETASPADVTKAVKAFSFEISEDKRNSSKKLFKRELGRLSETFLGECLVNVNQRPNFLGNKKNIKKGSKKKTKKTKKISKKKGKGSLLGDESPDTDCTPANLSKSDSDAQEDTEKKMHYHTHRIIQSGKASCKNKPLKDSETFYFLTTTFYDSNACDAMLNHQVDFDPKRFDEARRFGISTLLYEEAYENYCRNPFSDTNVTECKKLLTFHNVAKNKLLQPPFINTHESLTKDVGEAGLNTLSTYNVNAMYFLPQIIHKILGYTKNKTASTLPTDDEAYQCSLYAARFHSNQFGLTNIKMHGIAKWKYFRVYQRHESEDLPVEIACALLVCDIINVALSDPAMWDHNMQRIKPEEKKEYFRKVGDDIANMFNGIVCKDDESFVNTFGKFPLKYIPYNISVSCSLYTNK